MEKMNENKMIKERSKWCMPRRIPPKNASKNLYTNFRAAKMRIRRQKQLQYANTRNILYTEYTYTAAYNDGLYTAGHLRYY